jgi:hypothetical protein
MSMAALFSLSICGREGGSEAEPADQRVQFG